jgi:hypothetical protein
MFARIASFQGGDVERLREMNEQRMSEARRTCRRA